MASIRESIEENERRILDPKASLAAESRGRLLAEEPHPFRTAYQRDRDRILHSKAFRRLAHKTQVFLAPEHDHYRVRLTHTLEVTQVARTIARALRLNEDLSEAICLGHDLGHTPFGHLGEEVLSEFLGRTFRHNEQSLRIVDHLETRGDKQGLNLTSEVRDGILNHTWSMPMPSTLEGQVARFADRIAYINHDIDDAIRAGVLKVDDLPEATLSCLGRTSSTRVDAMVASLIEASAGSDQIGMAPQIFDALLETRDFLFQEVYQRPEVIPEQQRARSLLLAVCKYFGEHPQEIPTEELVEPTESAAGEQTRLIDYIAGMTDRFALSQYERIVRK